MMEHLYSLLLLIAAHALCDYPLQGDFLSKAKNHRAPVQGVPWWQAMSGHCAIHAGAVLLILGSPVLALAEFVAHFATDRAKCAGSIGYNADQALHIAAKFTWLLASIWLL